MNKRLTKSNTNIVVSGVLGGIAEYFNIDATILRVIYVVFLFLGWGSPILLYIILAVIMPRDSGTTKNPRAKKQRDQGYYRNSYDDGQPFYNRNQTRKETPRKEAEKVDDNTDQWSDF